MVVKWASASGDPAAEHQSCIHCFFSVGQLTTNDNADLNLSLDLDLNTGSRNLFKVNKIDDALIDHCACAAWKTIVYAASAHSRTMLLDWQKLTPI